MEAYSKLGMIDGRCAHCYNTSVAVIGDFLIFILKIQYEFTGLAGNFLIIIWGCKKIIWKLQIQRLTIAEKSGCSN